MPSPHSQTRVLTIFEIHNQGGFPADHKWSITTSSGREKPAFGGPNTFIWCVAAFARANGFASIKRVNNCFLWYEMVLAYGTGNLALSSRVKYQRRQLNDPGFGSPEAVQL